MECPGVSVAIPAGLGLQGRNKRGQSTRKKSSKIRRFFRQNSPPFRLNSKNSGLTERFLKFTSATARPRLNVNQFINCDMDTFNFQGINTVLDRLGNTFHSIIYKKKVDKFYYLYNAPFITQF